MTKQTKCNIYQNTLQRNHRQISACQNPGQSIVYLTISSFSNSSFSFTGIASTISSASPSGAAIFFPSTHLRSYRQNFCNTFPADHASLLSFYIRFFPGSDFHKMPESVQNHVPSENSVHHSGTLQQKLFLLLNVGKFPHKCIVNTCFSSHMLKRLIQDFPKYQLIRSNLSRKLR